MLPESLTAVASLCAGLSLCGGVVARGLAGMWIANSRRQAARIRLAHETQGFRDQVQSAWVRTRAKNPHRRAWSGARNFRVAALHDECRDCRSFYLTPEDNRPLPRFQPGQYLTLEIPVPGSERPLVRCYSLSDRPRDDYYRITVKRAGKGSSYLLDHVKADAVLQARAPGGEFFLDPLSREPIVLIAGGIGVTPMLSMLNTIVHEQPGRRVYFFAGMRNADEHPFRLRLREAVSQHSSLKLDVNYSSPGRRDAADIDFHREGRLTIERIRTILPSNNFTFYVCGSGPMMEQLIPGLEAWGVPPTDIYYEAFGPSTVRKPETSAAASQSTATGGIHFSRSNRVWRPKCHTLSILEAAEMEGLQLPSGCRAGSCGECVVRLLQGKIKTLKMPGVPLADNECLSCISLPDGEIVVDA